MKRLLVLVLWCLAASSWAATATAQSGDVAAAADAFTRAQEAELRGDWERAAELYGLADRIAPAPEALRSAANAARQAGLNATAATHARSLLIRYPDDAESRARAEELLRELEPQLVRVQVRCAVACRVLIDGGATTGQAATEHTVYTRPAPHQVTVSYEGGVTSEPQQIEGAAGAQVDVEFAAPSAESSGPVVESGEPVTPTAPASSGISPAFFIAGCVATAALGGTTIWSGVDTLDAHSTYDPAAPDAEERFQDGRDRETRTNVLIGVTAGVAVVTVILAIFTDFGGGGGETTAGLPYLVADASSFMLGWAGTIR